ncbi:DUF6081 family protein [Rhizohabitans arisaemae]|uniref:DUF6081 family protein n=1 Tax=Rhizohabitans arisaemae TaxID=2720610 RepID=UPI0024B261C9|nr:DUF6081 family protein [Rhizohabitans arisaemae]
MTDTLSSPARTYDHFSGPDLDTAKWMYLEYPMPEGPPWRCADPGAVTAIADGALTVDIDEFRLRHDTVQIMDNPKYLLLSTEEFALGEGRRVTFTVDMAVTSKGGDPRDYRDGVAAFNVVDMESGWVFDVAANSDHVWAIHEMLPVPTAAARPFTRMVEDPFANLPPGPGRTRRCQVTIDTSAGSVAWLADGAVINEVTGIRLPGVVRLGLGVFTLHSVAGGASRSIRGQGISVTWSGLTVETADAGGAG